jgi:hypothetical protein
MHICKFNGTYLQCSPNDRCYPEKEMEQCEGYERGEQSIDPAFCKYAWDADGRCTDECQCPAVRKKAREEYEALKKQERRSSLPPSISGG